jgi:hypothetical protein
MAVTPVAKSFSSGTTAGVALEAQAVTLNALTITAAATSVVTIFDNAAAASGTILFQKSFAAATNSYQLRFPGGLRAANGLFLVVATAASGVVAYVS